MSTETKQHNVVATRVFDAPVERVWRAWSEPEQVKQWWGPHGFSVPVANVDFREGGVTLVAMRAPAEYGLPDMYNTWTYTRIVPHERLEFTLNFSDASGAKFDPAQMPGMPPGIPLDVPHVITFKPVGDHQTEMTLTEYGYTSAEAHDTSLAGLEQVLDKLDASLKVSA
jgi:uncharacterized protein YndB with AHSA1/START domain